MTVYQQVGATAPSVADTLRKSDGTPFDLTGCTVHLMQRPMFSTVVDVDAAAVIVTPPGVDGKVRYDWAPADAALGSGPYRAWWRITLPSLATLDSPEFTVVWAEHATDLSYGPATDWTDAQDILACCADATEGTCLQSAAAMASAVLYEMSGERFLGYAQATVRPCRTFSCGMFGPQILDHGHIVWAGRNWIDEGGQSCGCIPIPEVALAGYPVTSIDEVKIGGVVLDPAHYRLDRHRELVRTDGGWWPACQSLALDDSLPGTWSVTYQFGSPPPLLGVRAAAQLACEFWKACAGLGCELPAGVTTMTRQGVTVQRGNLSLWLTGGTGLALVDAFLAAYGTNRKRATVWSPDLSYPRRV